MNREFHVHLTCRHCDFTINETILAETHDAAYERIMQKYWIKWTPCRKETVNDPTTGVGITQAFPHEMSGHVQLPDYDPVPYTKPRAERS